MQSPHPSCWSMSQKLVEDVSYCYWCLVLIASRRGCSTWCNLVPFNFYFLDSAIYFLLFLVFQGLIYYLDTFSQQVTSFSLAVQLPSPEAPGSQMDRGMHMSIHQHCFLWRVREGYGQYSWLVFFLPFLFKMAIYHMLRGYSKPSIFCFFFLRYKVSWPVEQLTA